MNQLYWISSPWPGRIAILPRPRGGDWLDDEIADWKMQHLDAIVCLLTPGELRELELDREQELVEQHDLLFFSFPIPDRSIPDSLAAAQRLTQELCVLAGSGKQIGIHCRQGIGRSSMIAASMLVSAGLTVEQAFQRIEDARMRPVPDTEEQRQWVGRLARAAAFLE